MTTKPDPRVDAYIAKSAAFAQPILNHLRVLVHRACPAATETIKWSHVFFEHHGLLCNLAAFKAHCAFGFHHQGMEEILRRDGVLAEDAAGSLGRVASLDALPSDAVLVRYIRQAAKLNESGTPRRPARKAKPALPVPADLAAALRKNKRANAAFEKFPPGHRREYIEWITEAKRPETREKRLATTLEWLAEGKPRNWKYADC
ncbi:MAG: YdeI/OmpD-associated family protein [Verrucomicrobia bacterium]|nr:YdeI/OmpD-associated family protein [Verrucomicrobiota bacterium]